MYWLVVLKIETPWPSWHEPGACSMMISKGPLISSVWLFEKSILRFTVTSCVKQSCKCLPLSASSLAGCDGGRDTIKTYFEIHDKKDVQWVHPHCWSAWVSDKLDSFAQLPLQKTWVDVLGCLFLNNRCARVKRSCQCNELGDVRRNHSKKVTDPAQNIAKETASDREVG